MHIYYGYIYAFLALVTIVLSLSIIFRKKVSRLERNIILCCLAYLTIFHIVTWTNLMALIVYPLAALFFFLRTSNVK